MNPTQALGYLTETDNAHARLSGLVRTHRATLAEIDAFEALDAERQIAYEALVFDSSLIGRQVTVNGKSGVIVGNCDGGQSCESDGNCARVKLDEESYDRLVYQLHTLRFEAE